jgi:DNA-directed RNA polymerase specialized sigma24 family protein
MDISAPHLMDLNSTESRTDKPHGAAFPATRWSLVLRSREELSLQRRAALEDMCRAYWYPLYAFLRRSGRNTEDAQDLVQDFFVKLIDGALLATATPEKGKFRTLLLAALKNMDANAWHAAQTQKRGGGAERVPLDAALAEERLLHERADAPPEAIFDRAWANTVMDRAGAALQAEYVGVGKAELFSELFPRLNGGVVKDGLAAVAARLGMSEAAVKMALSRMRPRYADALRNEISHTVGSHGDTQEELRYLLTAFL